METTGVSPPLPTAPRLSPAQKAYQDDPAAFQERLSQRASSLFENGYLVYPTDTPYLFAVVCDDKKGVREYRVHWLDGTCDCAFHTRQVNGEYLTPDQSILACKHQQGLFVLVKKTWRWLYQTDQLTEMCALWVHWMKTRGVVRQFAIAVEKQTLAAQQAQQKAQERAARNGSERKETNDRQNLG